MIFVKSKYVIVTYLPNAPGKLWLRCFEFRLIEFTIFWFLIVKTLLENLKKLNGCPCFCFSVICMPNPHIPIALGLVYYGTSFVRSYTWGPNRLQAIIKALNRYQISELKEPCGCIVVTVVLNLSFKIWKTIRDNSAFTEHRGFPLDCMFSLAATCVAKWTSYPYLSQTYQGTRIA